VECASIVSFVDCSFHVLFDIGSGDSCFLIGVDRRDRDWTIQNRHIVAAMPKISFRL